MTISKNKLKLIRSLAQKKYRDETGLFIAEGPKAVGDLVQAFECELIVATPAYFSNHPPARAKEVIEVDEEEFAKISMMKSAHEVMAVMRQPGKASLPSDLQLKADTLQLALDGVQDPGNLGTIIRIADWFGIENVFLSKDSADAFSPKTVQATMGALARVRTHRVDLPELIRRAGKDVEIIGTQLDGDDIYSTLLPKGGLVVMGNEGEGISEAVKAMVSKRIRIPSFPPSRPTSESLNVAVATAITCAEFRRRQSR